MLSLFLQAGPESIRDHLQAGLQATSASTLIAIHRLLHRDSSMNSTAKRPSEQPVELEQLRRENRELARHVAELRSENELLLRSTPLMRTLTPEPLIQLDAVSARVIGLHGEALSESLQLLISIEKDQGIAAGELVLSGTGLLIDQGKSLGLKPDQLVTAGRSLFGRTLRVGERTALVQPITDPEFRVAVRLVRRSALGAVQGPQGILVGTGNGCRLDEVMATEAVAAGDEVFTDRLASPGSEPIYCGRVTSAEADAGDHHWTIQVAPLQTLAKLPARLDVLRTELNSSSLPGSSLRGSFSP